MQTIGDLYVSDMQPDERNSKRDTQYRWALDNAIKADDAFRATLTDEQKKLFEALVDAQLELSILTEAETFTYSFRLGAKIMMVVLKKMPILLS